MLFFVKFSWFETCSPQKLKTLRKMAKASKQKCVDDEMLQMVKVDGRGWDSALFVNADKVSPYLCADCHQVCCGAVTLGCDHDEDKKLLYCNRCLAELIEQNSNMCIIDSHSDPYTLPHRTTRRRIGSLMIRCPFSRETACLWTGSLDSLIKNHLPHCTHGLKQWIESLKRQLEAAKIPDKNAVDEEEFMTMKSGAAERGQQ